MSLPCAHRPACETKAAPQILAVVRLQWIHCEGTSKFLAGPRGCRDQAHVVLWRHWQRVKRRSLHARRGIRPCDHETETITDVEQPARSAEYHSIITRLVDTLVSMSKILVLQLLDMDRACSDLVLEKLAPAFRPWKGNDLRLHLLVVL